MVAPYTRKLFIIAHFICGIKRLLACESRRFSGFLFHSRCVRQKNEKKKLSKAKGLWVVINFSQGRNKQRAKPYLPWLGTVPVTLTCKREENSIAGMTDIIMSYYYLNRI